MRALVQGHPFIKQLQLETGRYGKYRRGTAEIGTSKAFRLVYIGVDIGNVESELADFLGDTELPVHVVRRAELGVILDG